MQADLPAFAAISTRVCELFAKSSRFRVAASSIGSEGARLDEIQTDFQIDVLVRKAQAGDAQSFATLCDRYRKRVWRIVASVARGPDVDDLAQEAIVRAFCAIRSYRAEACFEAWLCRIALNLAHDYQRSAWKRRVI